MALVAGAWRGGARFEDAPAGEWSAMLGQNLDTAAHVCRAALPHLVEQGGSIVAVGSHAAVTGGAGMAAYAVAKSALHALVRVLALENRDRGVRVNAVLPGTIDTPANRAAMPAADRSAWTPPAAIARTIAFLLSPDSAPVTGALVPVDGPGAAGLAEHRPQPLQRVQQHRQRHEHRQQQHEGPLGAGQFRDRASRGTASRLAAEQGPLLAARAPGEVARQRPLAPGPARRPAAREARRRSDSLAIAVLSIEADVSSDSGAGDRPGRRAWPACGECGLISAMTLHATATRIWKHLPPEERLAATNAFFKETPPELAGIALGVLVKARHMRPQAARKLPAEAQARILASVLDPGEPLAQGLLVALHLAERRPLLSAFLDALGLPHEGGLLKEEADQAAAGDRGGGARGARGALRRSRRGTCGPTSTRSGCRTPSAGPRSSRRRKRSRSDAGAAQARPGR